MTVIHLSGGHGFKLEFEPNGEMLMVSLRVADGAEWCRFLAGSERDALNRAYELIESDAERAIINDMHVTKTHKLQVGDIVTIKKRGIGIIKSIQASTYWVSDLITVNGFYTESRIENGYTLEKLVLLPNREKWVQIKHDIERQGDGKILQEWIDTLKGE